MKINADHRGWMVLTLAVTIAGAVSYRMYVAASPYGASGGSWPGLIYGIAGTLAMVLAGLLAARKKVRTWRLGPARAWMQMHIWLGILAVPLLCFHAGFRLGGLLTTTLMVLFGVVTVSGLFGLVLQQYLPAMMTQRVPLETLVGQMDHVREGLASDAYELVASLAGVIPEAAEEQARLAAEQAALQARPGNWKQVARKPPATTPAPEAALVKEVYLQEIRPYLLRDARARGMASQARAARRDLRGVVSARRPTPPARRPARLALRARAALVRPPRSRGLPHRHGSQVLSGGPDGTRQ